MNKVNLSTSFDILEEQDKKYPNRRKEIHKGCCKNCPSNNNLKQGITDFESEQIKTYPKDLIIKEFLFVCAWRPNKLCKGLCDYHEIDEKLIKNIKWKHQPKPPIFKNMKVKKVLRYYSDCGRGFWKKQKAITHEENCKCWKNPKFKSCLSCKHKCFIKDSNGMENEPQFLQTWDINNCKYSESGVPIHQDFKHIRKYCNHHDTKNH